MFLAVVRLKASRVKTKQLDGWSATKFLRQNRLIDDVSFIDGTKILADDYYVDSKGIQFNFKAYRKKTDKYGFIRNFKEYVAEKLDENQNVIFEVLTPKGKLRRIQVNNAWECFKIKQRDLLSTSQTAASTPNKK